MTRPLREAMRIAISDYDGTLKRNDGVSGRDLRAIRRWRAGGGRFGLATGRDLGMTVHEIRLWDIPFDFLVCANGCGVYDSDLSLIAGVDLPDDLVPAILGHPAAAACLDCKLLGDGLAKVLINSPASRFPGRGLPYLRVDIAEAIACRGLRQISLSFSDAGMCDRWSRAIEADFAGRIAVHRNTTFMDVTVGGVGKETGIARLIAAKGWEAGEVLVIGDGGNDIGMIRRFRGWAVAGGDAEVLSAAAGVCGSVAEMLERA